ncbi:hypothetical protein ACSSS7_006895 [Eimeria intestinalis]
MAACTTPNDDVEVCLTESKDAPLPARVPPSKDCGGQQPVHGGRNIPPPPAVEHHSLHQARLHDAKPRGIDAHYLSYYGGHVGIAKMAARLAFSYCWFRLQQGELPDCKVLHARWPLNYDVASYARLPQPPLRKRSSTRLLKQLLEHIRPATHAFESTPGAACTTPKEDVEVCLTESKDEPLPARVPPSNDCAGQRLVHEGRNIPPPPAVEHHSLHQARLHDAKCPRVSSPGQPSSFSMAAASAAGAPQLLLRPILTVRPHKQCPSARGFPRASQAARN